MKKSTFLKSLPQQLGVDDDDVQQTTPDSLQPPETFVKRPKIKARRSATPRTSFALEDEDDDNAGTSGVIKAKKTNLSKVAIQRNASKRSVVNAPSLPVKALDEDDESRPNYSAASLRELKQSTPSTPRDFAVNSHSSEDSPASTSLDVASKFAHSLSLYQNSSAIPSPAEIAEKKARRARLAKELEAEEYISLDPDDPNLDTVDDEDNTMLDERGRLVLKPKDKYDQSESRLVRDDEDIMENFDEFTEDGRIPLGKTVEMEAIQKRRHDMAAQIAEAEAEGDKSDSDESTAADRQRKAEFEAVQTRHGAYETASDLRNAHSNQRPRTPPHISPLPTLDGALGRLRKQLAELQALQGQKLRDMEALGQEKVRLGLEEIRIQKNLRETADKYKQMREEKEIAPAPVENSLVISSPDPSFTTRLGVGEGTAINRTADSDSEASGDSNAAGPELGATAFDSSSRRGLGMGRPRDEEEDW